MFAYALTIFSGAFLLFQVQPLIGKYILPWFGGSPGVWTTCMLSFQTMLLAGYAYAHGTARFLKPAAQAMLHLALLALALALLPIIPADTWKPSGPGDPTWRILALLTVNLGLPYLVLSATSPLIQHWCSRTHPDRSPYRLYALSNAGSLLALTSYPFYFEWAFTRREQASLWAWGLGFFAIVCGVCAVRYFSRGASLAEPAPATAGSPSESSGADRLLWIGLPATGSVLLLATTNKICQDLAVIPFLWVLPLAIYLLTFIIAFDSPRWYVRWFFSLAIVASIAAVGFLLFQEDNASDDGPSIAVQIAVYCAAMFAGCMFCHGEVYRLKPHPRRLTAYYLMIAAGGAIGGVLVAVVAPLVFNAFLELQLGYCVVGAAVAVMAFRDRDASIAFGAAGGALVAVPILCILRAAPSVLVAPFALVLPPLRPSISSLTFKKCSLAILRELPKFAAQNHWLLVALAVAIIVCFGDPKRVFIRAWRTRAGLFLVLLALSLAAGLGFQARGAKDSAVSMSRNFFGMLTVYKYDEDDPGRSYYLLQHGKITHGLQFTDAAGARLPTTYYGRTSGVGLAIANLRQPANHRRFGLVGLGTGTLSVYAEKGDYLRIYEINPAVERLAKTRFTYLKNCPADVEIALGDARLSMEAELKRGEPRHFDLLALDAFNGDAIPVHLLTVEAFATYLREIKPNGVIAVHISNLYLDLEPVVANLAKHFNLGAVTISEDDNPDWWIYPTTWVLVSRDRDFLKSTAIQDAADAPWSIANPSVPLWTDDYTSLFKILRWD